MAMVARLRSQEYNLTFSARTVPILDILHALAYVWEAAGLFEKEDKQRKAFTRERLLRILRGDVQGVISGLRRMGTTHKLSGKAAEDLARICGYLEKNSDRMRYDEYLRQGYPIASGVIEGACRHLVKDRMERSGMRWTLEGARSMLHVRATFQSDHWRSFLDHRIKCEAQLNHQHREILGDYQPLTLACLPAERRLHPHQYCHWPNRFTVLVVPSILKTRRLSKTLSAVRPRCTTHLF